MSFERVEKRCTMNRPDLGPVVKESRSLLFRGVKLLFGCFLACCLMLATAVVGLLLLYKTFLRYPDASYLQDEALEGLHPAVVTTRHLDGFSSPYLGHTGSWDGKGGGMFGSSKNPSMDEEVGMGLRWTFMPVYWSELEPDGPVDLAETVPEAWQALDAFVIAAQAREAQYPSAGACNWWKCGRAPRSGLGCGNRDVPRRRTWRLSARSPRSSSRAIDRAEHSPQAKGGETPTGYWLGKWTTNPSPT